MSFGLATWLLPGIRIKRWIVLALVGAALVYMGLAAAFPDPLLGWFERAASAISREFEPGSAERTALGIAAALIGLVVMVAAVIQIGASLALAQGAARPEKSLARAMQKRRLLASGPKIAVVGGGTGLSTLLRGLKEHTSNIAAIVTVTDEGGSSGRLRREMRVIPPGDLRNCIAALADSESLMTQLMQFRFNGTKSSLEGHSLGNLLITALADITGDFEQGVKETSKVLAIRGRVLPSTTRDVRLRGKLADGSIVDGETKIVEAPQAVERVSLIPSDPEPLEESVDAIREADVIVIGPGSVFTSIIPNLLVPGIVDAIAESRAVKVFVSNVMTQPGETDGFAASDHAKVVAEHAGRKIFDYVLVNNAVPSRAMLEKYREERQFVVEPDIERIADMGYRPVVGNLISETDFVRHDSGKLTRAIFKIAKLRP
jgi:uncharacterized cofD-like protein